MQCSPEAARTQLLPLPVPELSEYSLSGKLQTYTVRFSSCNPFYPFEFFYLVISLFHLSFPPLNLCKFLMCASLFMFRFCSLGFERSRRNCSLSFSIDFVLPPPQFGVNTVFFRPVLSYMFITSHKFPFTFKVKLNKI